MLQNLSHIATVIIAFCTGWGLLYAKHQIRNSREAQREATAKSIFQDYLKACLSYPKLVKPNFAEIKADPALLQEYECFRTLVLNACEEIHLLFPNDSYWTHALYSHLTFHKDSLSASFNSDAYSKAFQKLVNDVVTGNRGILKNDWR
jgi:hypothetical protein